MDEERLSEVFFEKQVFRDFQPLAARKWRKSEYSLSIHGMNFNGVSHKGISNHEVYFGLKHIGTYVYAIKYFGNDAKTVLHRVGGPAALFLRDNRLVKARYYLFGNSLPISNYWLRVFAIKPEIYKTKLIGSTLFIETLSNKIPAPSSIDLYNNKGTYKIMYELSGRKVSELEYWSYWENHFTILQDQSLPV